MVIIQRVYYQLTTKQMTHNLLIGSTKISLRKMLAE